MVHTVVWRVASDAALGFWAERLGAPVEGGAVRARDPEGLAIEIARLRAELRRQLDEVAASRARIVAADGP